MTSKFFFSLGGIQVREDSISKEDSFNRNVGNVPLCNEYIYICLQTYADCKTHSL